MIHVYEPYLNKQILFYAHDALDSTWISSTGAYLQVVEERLKELLNVPFVILTNNGTTATHLVAKGLAKYMEDIYRYKHSTLLVPNNVYVAAWNSFLYDGKFTLQPLDADIETWNFSLRELDDAVNFDFNLGLDTSKVKPVLVVHNLGNIIDVPLLKKKYRSLPIVEDCCEGLFGMYSGRQAGTESLIASYSFYGNKNVTSGEGGAVVTHDVNLYEYMNKLRGQGQSKEKFIHDELGYNYRMTNIEAALLYGQLEYKDEIMAKKRELFWDYDSVFEEMPEIETQISEVGTVNANWMYGIRIKKTGHTYKKAETYFKNEGIEIRPMFYPMSRHAHLAGIAHKNHEVVATLLNEQCIILPSHPNITTDEFRHIVETVGKYLGE